MASPIEENELLLLGRNRNEDESVPDFFDNLKTQSIPIPTSTTLLKGRRLVLVFSCVSASPLSIERCAWNLQLIQCIRYRIFAHCP